MVLDAFESLKSGTSKAISTQDDANKQVENTLSFLKQFSSRLGEEKVILQSKIDAGSSYLSELESFIKLAQDDVVLKFTELRVLQDNYNDLNSKVIYNQVRLQLFYLSSLTLFSFILGGIGWEKYGEKQSYQSDKCVANQNLIPY